ncbi:MAG: CHAT domain-containing protein [Cyanobacteria bacterium P01_G01_bin.54]
MLLFRSVLGFTLFGTLWALGHESLAQSITASLDGTGTVIEHNGNTYHIKGGTQAGANLFHSFQTFGLSSGETANFLSDPTVVNLFGRVTGGNASQINGLIQANPNLYLMNPAGIILGTDARLNIGGDFLATTADRIGFAGGWLNTIGSNDYGALVGEPKQFAFLSEQPGAILNFGDLTTAGDVSLLGGTVFNQGAIASAQGTVTLAAVPGERFVQIRQPGMLLRLEVDAGAIAAGITPLDLPTLLTGSGTIMEALPQSDPPFGNVVIGGSVSGETIDLYAAGQVKPANPALVVGDTRVIRFSATEENPDQAVFVDARVEHSEALLYGAAAGTVSQMIEREEQGSAVIREQLAVIRESVGKLESVAIVAEGNEGNFWLGKQWLRAENLEEYQADLQAWGEAITESADLLLYSCFTALGETGEALVARLAEMTGADVAASVDVTGSDHYQGDWHLEYRTGSIDEQIPFTPETLTDWEGKLAAWTVTSSADAGPGSLRDRIETDAGNGDMIVFDSARTVTLTSGEITWTTDDLELDGNGSIVDGGGNDRVFHITANDATIQNLTIQNGSVTNLGGGINYTGTGVLALDNVQILNNIVAQRAAGIRSTNGLVVLRNSLVSGNSAGLGRGGISVDNNDLILINSIISDNLAGTFAGGVRADNITVINSTITKNSAGSRGGGIHHPDASGSVTLINSTLTQNTAGDNGGGINSDGAVSMTNSTLAGNVAGDDGGGINADGAVTLYQSTVSGNSANLNGGGIQASDTVTLSNAVVVGNIAGNNGGGIFGQSDVTLDHATISGNHSGSNGGGVFSLGAVTSLNATLSDNVAASVGGGLASLGAINLTQSTVSGNSAAIAGGGILGFGGDIRLANTTLSGNHTAGKGGGLYSLGNVALTNATIAFNTATTGQGGGVYISGTQNNTIANTIIANNTAAAHPDISANFSTSTARYSLITDTTGITGLALANGVNGNIINQDPLLGPLQNNGGSTATHALQLMSPAINAGKNALALAANGIPLTIDQMGQLRIIDDIVDIGAYEFPVVTSVIQLPICGLSCTPYAPLPLIEPEPTAKDGNLLFLAIDGIEVKMTNDYTALVLDRDDVKPLTIAQSQTLMQDIEQQTGVRPAVIYFTFGLNSFAHLTLPHEQAGAIALNAPPLNENPITDRLPMGTTPVLEPRRTAAPLKPTYFSVPLTQAHELSNNRANGDDPLQLILITPDGDPIVRRPLGVTRSQVEQEVQALQIGLNSVVGDTYLPAAQQLYDWLIRPLQDDLQALEIEHLSIVADEGLRALPMAALQDGEQFLIEAYSLALIPSLSLIDWRYMPLHNATILAMGASEFADQPPLPAVPIELNLITEHAQQKYLNDGFTYSNLRSQANQRQFQILHLATHARFRPGAADAAYIQLWDGEDVPLQGLRDFKLYQDPALELLVLSACETAVGDAAAELGFAGAALQSGVKSVLASLWQVSDVGTLALMNSFYAQLADPAVTIKAEALRQAQLALLHRDVSVRRGYLGETVLPPGLADYPNIDLSHPYYWSAFTLVGSPW